jgi:hypothetical protein
MAKRPPDAAETPAEHPCFQQLARRRLRPLEKGARRREKESDLPVSPSPFSLLPSPAFRKLDLFTTHPGVLA